MKEGYIIPTNALLRNVSAFLIELAVDLKTMADFFSLL